jgi:MFS family permease
MGVLVAFGYAIGPIVGGVLSENVSWRVCLIQFSVYTITKVSQWCFWVSVPISFIATGIVLFVLPLKTVRGSVRT